MRYFYKFIILVAMVLMGIASMYTTYISLRDSILPMSVTIPIKGYKWDCAWLALCLSVAIGLMLFALKGSIIDGQKRLNFFGLIGLTVVSFISIAFNMDVLYRTADRDFYFRYAGQTMRSVYEVYLTEVQTKLLEKQTELRKMIATQEGEMEAEVKGLRQAPAGYGPLAKQEDYKLTLIAKQVPIELEKIDAALKTKEQADQLLLTQNPATVDEIQKLQNDLRVTLKDMGAAAGVPLPAPVQTENPLFTVFRRLFDYKTIGLKEIFFLAIALFMDLGDILGYVLVPNRRRQDMVVMPVGRAALPRQAAVPVFRTAELASEPARVALPRANGAHKPEEHEEEADYEPQESYPRRERFMIPPAEEA